MRKTVHAAQMMLAGVLFAMLAVLVVLGQPQAVDTTPAAPSPGYAGHILARHDCWTHDGPKGVLPGHAVISRDGGLAHYTDSHVALDHVFNHKHPKVTVYGFCR